MFTFHGQGRGLLRTAPTLTRRQVLATVPGSHLEILKETILGGYPCKDGRTETQSQPASPVVSHLESALPQDF